MNCAKYLRGYVVGVAMAFALVNSTVVCGQTARTCDEGNPFISQMVEHIVSEEPDGTERKQDDGGLRARDNDGRVYAELRFSQNDVPTKKAESADGPRHFSIGKGPEIHSIISISDCHTGETITIFPDLKSVRIASNTASWKRENGASFFEFLTSGPRPTNATIEDLGFKEVEGVLAHGYRETVAGTEDEGKWNGKTRFVMESWISDDLAEIVLRTITNLKIRTTTTVTLTGIKREEPPKSLFKIPSDYKVERPPDKTTPSSIPAEPKAEN